MVISCSAYGCKNRHKKGDAISFHTFPKDKTMRTKWIIATKRENFVPTSASRLCSAHFESTDFVVRFGQKKVAPNAVPSIFPFPDHLQKKKKSRSTISTTSSNLITQTVDTPTPDEPPPDDTKDFALEPSLPVLPKQEVPEEVPEEVPPIRIPSTPNRRRQPCYFRDFKEKHLKSPRKVKKMWILAAAIIEKKEKMIKMLRNKTYRLQKKVQSLQDLLTHLRTSQRISDNHYYS